MSHHRLFCTLCFLALACGCRISTDDPDVLRDVDVNPVAVHSTHPNEEQKRRLAKELKEHRERFPTVAQVALVNKVRERLPSLKPGMTKAEVSKALGDLSLGEEMVVSRTISGAKTVQYALSLRYHLELAYHRLNLNDPPPGRLSEAKIIDLYP